MTKEFKKLIRSRATGRFLTKGGEWTPDSKLAEHFPSAQVAAFAVMRRHLADVEFYYQFGATRSDYDFTVPLLS